LRAFVEPLGPQEVARRANKSRQQLEKILKGQNINPTLDVLGAYARGTGHDLEDLFTRPGDGPADEASQAKGAALLGRLLADVDAGTWEEDLATAITAIANAMRRQRDRESAHRSAAKV
jgi:transcriptional regulator with XRE-family HTH domain